jgi:hypothetical protein
MSADDKPGIAPSQVEAADANDEETAEKPPIRRRGFLALTGALLASMQLGQDAFSNKIRDAAAKKEPTAGGSPSAIPAHILQQLTQVQQDILVGRVARTVLSNPEVQKVLAVIGHNEWHKMLHENVV